MKNWRPTWERVAPLADGTKTRAEVAAILGITPGAVSSAALRAKAVHGLKMDFKPEPPGLKPEHWTWPAVAKLADGTRTRREIAARLGVSVKAVDAARTRAAKHGVEIRFLKTRGKRHAWEVLCDRGELRIGRENIATLVRSLPEEIANWIAGQVPEGGTMTDVIRGIIVDAYHEEKGDE